eukprot:3249284-Pleurochrysis_carterae.AAC.1
MSRHFLSAEQPAASDSLPGEPQPAFPDASCMSGRPSNSRPGKIYRRANSSVYQRFHPVHLKALNPHPACDGQDSSTPAHRYYVWSVSWA